MALPLLLALAVGLNAGAHDKRDMELVGAHGLEGRGAYQPVIQRQGARWIAYVGHHAGRERNPLTGAVEDNGTSILDVTDARTPRLLAHIAGEPGGGAQMARVCAGSDLPRADRSKVYLLRTYGDSAHEVWDVTEPARPARVSVVSSGLAGTHKSWWECDSGIAYLVSGVPGWRTSRMTQVYDLADPARPRFIRDFGLPGQQPGATGQVPTGLHGPISTGPTGNRIYFGYGTNSNGVLQVVDRRKLLEGPSEPTEANLVAPQVGRFDLPPAFGAHTAFPIEGLGGRDYVLVVNEALTRHCREEQQKVWLVDVTVESRPAVVSTWMPEGSARFCARGRFGAHASNESFAPVYYRKLVFVSWFNAGVRVLDIRDPARPVEVAYFIPAGDVLTNNVEVDERGYIYAVDRGGLGLHILELSGRARGIANLPRVDPHQFRRGASRKNQGMRTVDAGSAAPGRGAPSECFHCGLRVPVEAAFRFDAPEGPRHFCCAGCEAVSGAISGLGLDDYYRLRAQPAARPEAAPVSLAAFDEPSVRSRFVTDDGSGVVEADLLIEGLRCAACAWLVEQTLLRQQGVVSAQVQYATRRARVRWEAAAAAPSALLHAVARIGYTAWPYDEGRVALVEAGERRALLRRLWVAGLGMMQVMMYAFPGYIAGEGEIGTDAAGLMRWASLLLTLPVMMYSAGPMFRGAWRDLRVRHLGMDVPVALGLAVAFAGSAWATVAGAGEVYFDSVTMFVFLLLGARYLELVARGRAGQSLAHLARLVPQSARRLRGPAGLDADSVPVASLVPGDRVLVLPGETVPADGELESTQATLDEAWMTGESRPVAHAAGDAVLGGAVNAGSALVMTVRRVGESTAISAIRRLMERAFCERPRCAGAAQRAVPLFVSFVLAAAAGAFVMWLAIDPARAPWIAVSVLIVTCPCALALAAPAAVTIAAGSLARSGVVVTRLDAIESLAGVTDVVFDKTGTLTTGRVALADTYALDGRDARSMLALAAALAQASAHPLDAAIVDAARGTSLPRATAHASVAGQGVEAIVGGQRVRLGRSEHVAALHGKPLPLSFIGGTDPIAWLGDETGWLAAFRFTDAVRVDAARAIARLRALGLQVHLLSGDRRPIVHRLAVDSGVERWRSDATPEGKRAYVRALQDSGARVAMVGDGVNDAPVLAQADVSLAMGCGADVAKVSADAVLLGNSPSDVVQAIALARKTRRIVRQNLGWALGYNAIAIPLALAGLVTPLAAGIGMSASSLGVIANALRIRA